MSGICGIVHLDGAPADRGALAAMAAAMAFRGPDAQESRRVEGGGLARSLLRTGSQADPAQPLSLDGRTWLLADARIDAQAELRGALEARGRVLEGCCDAGLILHAWHEWGEDCVSHLLGDFAFVVWESEARRLVCARDPFGVKSLFLARVGDAIVFGNTMDSVRAHPAVPQGFDALALADFLLFEQGLDPEATGFAAIRRLPPGRMACFTRAHTRMREYWSLPGEPATAGAGRRDCAEQLGELLRMAVADRLRTSRAVVQMSGGLDSTAIAAVARHVLAGRRAPFDLRAHTMVYDRLVPDGERAYAELAARTIGIPQAFHAGDDRALYERFDRYEARFPAPHHGPDVIVGFDCLVGAAGDARVMLTGYDGDALLDEPPRRPLRAFLRRALGRARSSPPPEFPRWLSPSLAARLRLRDRWRDYHAKKAREHPARPSAHRFLTLMRETPALFDQYEPGTTGLPLECRHPFLDLRVVRFCLELEPRPWCEGKMALREAMRGVLPEAVRARPKTPLGGWPGGVLLGRGDAAFIDRFVASPRLAEYVDRPRIPAVGGSRRPHEDWMHLRPFTLELWMRRQIAGLTSKELLDEIA